MMDDKQTKIGRGAIPPRRVILSIMLCLFLAVNFPAIAIKGFLVVDFFFPIDVQSTTLFQIYHNTVTYFLKEKAAKPIPELIYDGINASKWENVHEELRTLSNNYRDPVVMRQAGTVDARLQKKSFWMENYGEEEVICVELKKNELKSNSQAFCNIKEFFQKKEKNELNGLYVSGASSIFNRRPELQKLAKTTSGNVSILGTEPSAHQIFIGFGGQGSEIHNAITANVFYQIQGRKSWVFFPVSQTPYLKPVFNPNPFALQTNTIAQNPVDGVSPWVKKLERYEAVLNPGDILFNPSWYWHSVYNLGSEDDLVIGVPVRYEQPKVAVANSPFFTLFLASWIRLSKGGREAFLKDFKNIGNDGRDGFERMLVGNRATTGNAVGK